MNLVETQLEDLRQRYPRLSYQKLPSGTVLVEVPGVGLPAGWAKAETTVRFLIPAAYPYAALDCFWADIDLRLGNGQLPMNSAVTNPIPEIGIPGLWFSWHLAQPWNPNRDTLSSWMNTILARLQRLQ